MPLFSLVLAAALSVALPMPGSATATSPATQRHRVALKPGPKTTVFTGPLRKDGTVDYIAAWNQKYSKGVTPKNNGVVDIVNTMKPEGWKSSKIRKKFYNRLGVVPPGKNAPTYFINLFDFAKQQRWNKHKTDKAVDNILLSSKPWPAAVYPMAAAWVRANQSAIDAMKRAVAKPCWYAPMLLKGSDGTLKLAISWVGQESLLAHLICAQAMLRLHKRDVAGAWRNAMLLEHFSRISSTTPVLMNRLISISLDTFARGNIVMPIAKRGSLNPKQAKAMITDLRHLPPLQDTSEVVDQTSRIIALRFAQMLWAGRYPDQKDRHALRAEKQMHEPGFNINVLLRQINQACDHEIQILRLRPYPAMVKARKKFMKQLLDKLKKNTSQYRSKS